MKKMEDLGHLYESHSRAVYCFLLAQGAGPDIAEELTQETFYQAVRHVGDFRGESSVQTWLCGIAKHVWLAHLRRQGRTVSLEQEQMEQLEQDTAPSAEQQALSGLDSMAMLKALHRLKEPMREVVYLRLMGDLSFREIGEIMEHTETWARVNFYRGKREIIKEVQEHETETGV